MKVTLGKGKEVEITSWKAKHKKQFIKLIEEKGENMTGEDVAEVLIRQNIDKSQIFLSPDEAQYLLIKIKELSLGGEVDFSMECDNEECNKTFEVNLTLDAITHYTPSNYSEMDTITWRDIPSQAIFQKVCAENPNELDADIELILHIDAINGEQTIDFKTTLDLIDDMDIRDVTEINSQFMSVMAFLEMGSKIKCPHCGYEDDYQFDVIPNFFEELLPN